MSSNRINAITVDQADSGTGALILTAPLKIRQGSGSPLRVLALVEALVEGS